MLYLLDDWLLGGPPSVRSWLGGPDDVLRYEDLFETTSASWSTCYSDTANWR